MTVYSVGAPNASCAVPGCLCRDRTAPYPSDLTDEQWQVLRPEAEAVMTELRKSPGGAQMKHDLRAMLDAIGYVTRYGIEWRAMPVDFPPWPAAYAFFERWSARGMPQRLVDRLRGRIRVTAGRTETPTAALIDSQSVRQTTPSARPPADTTAARRSRDRNGMSPSTPSACCCA
jgi:transposase